MLDIIQTVTIFVLIGILSFNMTYKNKIDTGERKRFAGLFVSGIVLVFLIAVVILNRFNYSPLFLIPAGLVCALLIFLLRNKIFLFSDKCDTCGIKLPLNRILYFDSNKCEHCNTKEDQK